MTSIRLKRKPRIVGAMESRREDSRALEEARIPGKAAALERLDEILARQNGVL